MINKKILFWLSLFIAVPAFALASAQGKAKVKIYYTANTYGYLEACPS